MFGVRKRKKPRTRRLGWTIRLDRLHAFVLILLCMCILFSFRFQVDMDNLDKISSYAGNSKLLDPPGPLFHPEIKFGESTTTQQQHPSRVLIIAVAPRSIKHIVSLWSSLECFTQDVNHVAISGPDWSQSILERFLTEASRKIPQFKSGKVSIEAMVTVNDRYDVGLWCDALSRMGLKGSSTMRRDSSFDEIALLNDSIYALREYNEVFTALGKKNVRMTSLNYSFIHPKGTGDQYYWLESVWRGFDQKGIQTFVDYSCRPPSDPMFCSKAWWGKKGCIVENFERAMAWQFPREETVGLFPSDVPKEMLTFQHSFPSWVRNVPYWEKLVREQNFPISKVNWQGMIDSIDDDRLKTCTQHLDRSWLEGFDFSVATSAI